MYRRTYPHETRHFEKFLDCTFTCGRTTVELGYDRPLYDGFLHMTGDMLGPSPMHIKYLSYVYDGPIFLVPLSPSYPSSPVYCVGIVAVEERLQWYV